MEERKQCIMVMNKEYYADPEAELWQRPEFQDAQGDGEFDAGVAIDWLLSPQNEQERAKVERDYPALAPSLRRLQFRRDHSPRDDEEEAKVPAPTSFAYVPALFGDPDDPVSRNLFAPATVPSAISPSASPFLADGDPFDEDVGNTDCSATQWQPPSTPSAPYLLPPDSGPLPPTMFDVHVHLQPSGVALFVLMPKAGPLPLRPPPPPALLPLPWAAPVETQLPPPPLPSTMETPVAPAEPPFSEPWAAPVESQLPPPPMSPSMETWTAPGEPPFVEPQQPAEREEYWQGTAPWEGERSVSPGEGAHKRKRDACCVTACGPRTSARELKQLFADKGVKIAHLPRYQWTRDGRRVFWQKIFLFSPQEVDQLMGGKEKQRLPLGRRGFIQVERYQSSHSRRAKKRATARLPRNHWG